MEIELKDCRLLIEYENSSRGMLSNLARIYDLYENNNRPDLIVLFIRTKTHTKKHDRDYKNWKAFSSLIKKKRSNFQALSFDSTDLGWIDFIIYS